MYTYTTYICTHIYVHVATLSMQEKPLINYNDLSQRHVHALYIVLFDRDLLLNIVHIITLHYQHCVFPPVYFLSQHINTKNELKGTVSGYKCIFSNGSWMRIPNF